MQGAAAVDAAKHTDIRTEKRTDRQTDGRTVLVLVVVFIAHGCPTKRRVGSVFLTLPLSVLLLSKIVKCTFCAFFMVKWKETH